jgi:CSLREA domain-containing protein
MRTHPIRLQAARSLLGAGALLLALLLGGPPAEAATFTVGTTADGLDVTPGDGVCATMMVIGGTGGKCTLRAAIMEANALPGADVVNLPAGTYALTVQGRDEEGAAKGDLDITQSLTIQGAGIDSTIVDGNRTNRDGRTPDRVFDVLAPDVHIVGLTIRGGDPGDQAGGGIRHVLGGTLRLDAVRVTDNRADIGGGISSQTGTTLVLSGVTVSANRASGGQGGGIHNLGTVSTPPIPLLPPGARSVAQPTSVVQDNVAEIGYDDASGGGGIWNSGEMTLTNVTIGGNFAQHGGGIRNGWGGTLTLSQAAVGPNEARLGGGLSNYGTLTLTDATLDGNKAQGPGAGIENRGEMTLKRVTISGNQTGDGGGGIYHRSPKTATLINVTVSGNRAAEAGGIASDGAMTLTNVTIAHNQAFAAWAQGGGLYADQPAASTSTTIKNSVLAYNTPRDCQVAVGALTSLSSNLAGDQSCPLAGIGDQTGANSLLAALADNGGPTRTHALLPGSPAIDTGTSNGCPATDQRGQPRHQDGDGDGIALCDKGAYERTPPPTTPRPASG